MKLKKGVLPSGNVDSSEKRLDMVLLKNSTNILFKKRNLCSAHVVYLSVLCLCVYICEALMNLSALYGSD